MSPKKSLFDKLTGAMKINNEEEILAEEKPKTKIENTISEKKSEIKDEMEWPGETEGQLSLDVYQTDLDIVIKSTIAGVDSDDLDITITNDMLTIRGYRRKEEEIAPENYFYQECYWGPFSRSVILPTDVDPEKAEASLKNGLLTIKLPKIEKQKTRKIKIKNA